MAESFKTRGEKHRQNKSKYKNSSHLAQSSSRNQSKKVQKLESNWTRYEELNTNESSNSVGSNFAILANAPISRGSHFQFKADVEQRGTENSKVDTYGLFNIDLSLIGFSLSSIPFYERCSIPKELFSLAQQNVMKHQASKNKELYEKHISYNKKINTESLPFRLFNKHEKSDTFEPSNDEDDVSKHFFPKCTVDEVDSMLPSLNISSKIMRESDKEPRLSNTSNSGCEGSTAASILESESLQQWLDDILED